MIDKNNLLIFSCLFTLSAEKDVTSQVPYFIRIVGCTVVISAVVCQDRDSLMVPTLLQAGFGYQSFTRCHLKASESSRLCYLNIEEGEETVS